MGEAILTSMVIRMSELQNNNNGRLEHWYFRYIDACPLCGRESEYRERKFSPKPEDPAERVKFTEVWCGCEP